MTNDRDFADARLKSTQQTHKTVEDAEQLIGKQNELPIVDQIAFDEYLRLQKHPLLNDKKIHICSDGTKVNLGAMPHHVQGYVKHLPEAEQRKVMGLKTVVQQIQNKKTGLLRKAYGANVKGDGTAATNRILSTLDLKRPELIELFGRMFSLAEVHEVVIKVWKLPIKRETLEEWRRNNTTAISTRLEQFKREYSDVRLAYKRGRLEELMWLYNKRKRIHETTHKGEDHRLLLQTIEQIKKEVEGDLIRIDASINITTEDVAATVGDSLKFISIKEIVMGRIAAKMQVNPLTILKAMAQGYYYSQIHQEQKDPMPALPSAQVYDFDRIQRINQQREQEAAANPVQTVTITTTDAAKATSIKALLLEKLKQNQQNVNYVKNSISPLFVDKSQA